MVEGSSVVFSVLWNGRLAKSWIQAAWDAWQTAGLKL